VKALLDAADLVVDNVKLAYSEMIGETKESALTRTVETATSYRPPKAKKSSDNDEEGEEAVEESMYQNEDGVG
jgi:hypothetical protein